MAEERRLSWCPVILAIEREEREFIKPKQIEDYGPVPDGSSPGGSFDAR